MKIAFVHDWLVNFWGAEAVLKDIISKTSFNEAKIFCIYSNHKFFEADWKKVEIVSSLNDFETKIFENKILKKIPWTKFFLDYRNLMFYFPSLVEKLSKKINKYLVSWQGWKKIIISSVAAVKNINNFDIPTYLYLHSPMQYIWENYEENLKKLKFPKNIIYKNISKKLRPWDKQKNENDFEKIVVNSEYSKAIAKNIYGWEKMEIIFPQIDKKFFSSEILEPQDYYIFVWRVVLFAREIDKIINLFNKTWKKLLIVWDWPDLEKAKKLASQNIEFAWYIDNVDKKIELLSRSKWLINISKESFGMSSLESLCLWVPVFWYNEWNTPYLVNKENGHLVDNKDDQNLLNNFLIFDTKNFDREKIAQQAREKYKQDIKTYF